MTKFDRAQLAIVAGAPHPAETQSQPQHAGVRPATNGKEGLGMFIDAQGKPTDDPELGYYGRTARAQFEAAYQAALAENQPDAVVDVPEGAHVCAQCRGVPPDGKEEPFRVGRNLVWLHPECRRFYYPDGDPIPVPKHHCDHCDSVLGITKWWNWPGYPDGIWLHERCEGDWRAAHSQLDEEEAHQPATGKQPDAAADVPCRPLSDDPRAERSLGGRPYSAVGAARRRRALPAAPA